MTQQFSQPIKLAFIIPYRDRKEHKHFFDRYMKYIVEDFEPESYVILYIHQANDLPFNRGAMKNIGFLYIKQTYPTQYKNITIVFNDIDTIPYCKNLLDYETEHGKIKHFFGFTFALGGIFSIKGGDFEKINGFPNYWQWGFEDNVIHKRALEYEIEVDRSNFYEIGCHEILHFCDAMRKLIDRNILDSQFDKKYKEVDGLSKLKNVKFEKTGENMINVSNFETHYNHKNKRLLNYPIASGNKIQNPKTNQNNNKTLLFL